MHSKDDLLLNALKLNAVFSGFSSLCLLVAGVWLAGQFALDGPVFVYVVAGFLFVFSLNLARIVLTGNIRTWEIVCIIAGDIGWVVASVVLVALFHKAISSTALVLVGLVAVAVSIFAIMQILGLKRWRTLDGSI